MNPETIDQAASNWEVESAGAASQLPEPSARASAAPSGLYAVTVPRGVPRLDLPELSLAAEFFVPGKPKPGGSKRGFYNPKLKRVMIVDANPDAKDWKRTVQAFAWNHRLERLLDEALAVEAIFFLARPKGHYGARGLKPGAPAHPTTAPDASKLWRSTEDALTGVIWSDDARIVGHLVWRSWAGDGRTGALIRVFRLRMGRLFT